jgi:hypothetical protein
VITHMITIHFEEPNERDVTHIQLPVPHKVDLTVEFCGQVGDNVYAFSVNFGPERYSLKEGESVLFVSEKIMQERRTSDGMLIDNGIRWVRRGSLSNG